MELIYCKCGCGNQRPKYRSNKPGETRVCLFIKGHHRKGQPMSQTHKHKISLANIGRKMPLKQRHLLSKIRKENYKSGKLIHWSKTSAREDIAKKISSKRKGVPFTKTIKKGWYLANNGYIMVYFRNHFGKKYGYMLEHRFIMEKHLGRQLKRTEDVHHMDRDKTNNRLDNLVLFPSHSAHIKFHNSH